MRPRYMARKSEYKNSVALMKRSLIALGVEAKNREEAIIIGCNLLMDEKAVTYEYCESILKMLELYGPYFVVAPHFAIPHARNEKDCVKKLAVSFVRLSKPVYFDHSENDPVDMILTIASPDESSHMKFLSRVGNLLMSREVEILKYGSTDDVRIFLNSLLNGE
jgi:mannitol/fructose-specific phosphotransferase system IIA component (Ntr-type)